MSISRLEILVHLYVERTLLLFQSEGQDYKIIVKVCPHPDFLHFGAPGQMESKQILTPLWKGFTLRPMQGGLYKSSLA